MYGPRWVVVEVYLFIFGGKARQFGRRNKTKRKYKIERQTVSQSS